jgi:hypothetical protein
MYELYLPTIYLREVHHLASYPCTQCPLARKHQEENSRDSKHRDTETLTKITSESPVHYLSYLSMKQTNCPS